jgi:hypothetical protein
MTGNGPQLLLLWNHDQLHDHSEVHSQQASPEFNCTFQQIEKTITSSQQTWSSRFSRAMLALSNSRAVFTRGLP